MQLIQLKSVQDIDFNAAHIFAQEAAGQILKSPMVLSWLNRQTGQYSPNVECCGNDNKAAWEIYAESRGSNLRIEVNNDYVFMFREGAL